MKIRYVLLLFFLISFALITTFPLRGVIGLVDNQNKISYQHIEGFWWNGRLKELSIKQKKIGDLEISLIPLQLFTGKFNFLVNVIGSEIRLDGKLGSSFTGDYFLKDFKIEANPSYVSTSVKNLTLNISNIDIHIDYLLYNETGCLKAEGRGIAGILDNSAVFTKDIRIKMILKCRGNLLEVRFNSVPEGLLSGEVTINKNMEYSLEVRSKRISTKIKELAKLNIKLVPSLKKSGSLEQILDYL